jgi:hypothetical protein
MRQALPAIFALLIFASCYSSRNFPAAQEVNHTALGILQDTPIARSLFIDKTSTISEENIQRVLDGTYQLPQQLRIALIKIDGSNEGKYYWNDESYLKNQQSYIDHFTNTLRQSARVKKITLIPDLLVNKPVSFTYLREAAIRMQADVVVLFTVTSDVYTKYKTFARDDIKAFATTQLVILDVRTGLIPFSAISTKDVLSQKKKEETDAYEARSRIKSEAVLLTIGDIGEKVTAFLN